MGKSYLNKYDLPPSLFDLVMEKAGNPEDPKDIYKVLCDELDLQLGNAIDHPEEDGRFPTILQCAHILEYLRKEIIHIVFKCPKCGAEIAADNMTFDVDCDCGQVVNRHNAADIRPF